MVYFIPAAILFVAFFIKLLNAQITFTDPIYSGTSCTAEDMGDGTRLNCTGLGFLTADGMSLKTATTMYVTILSSTPIAAVGLGERVGGSDVWCKTTNFPATASGKTWASKSLTRLSNCCYNMITMYTSSATTYAAVKPYQAAVVANTYKWVFTPATTSYTCWQVDISMPYPDGSFTDFTDSPGFVCTSTKSFYYASNIILAPYFELEASGTTSFYIQSELCSAISDCISCPDSSTCQFCRPGYQVMDCGTCTNSTNLTCPVVVTTDTSSDTSTNSTNSTDSSTSTNSTDSTNSTTTGDDGSSTDTNSATGDDGSSTDTNSATGDDGSSSDTNSTTEDDGSSSSNSTTEDDGLSSSNSTNSTTEDDGSSTDTNSTSEDDGSSSNSTTGDDGSSSSNSTTGDDGSFGDTNSTSGDNSTSSNSTTGDDGSSSNITTGDDGSSSNSTTEDDGSDLSNNSTNTTDSSGGDSSNTGGGDDSGNTNSTDSSGGDSSDNSESGESTTGDDDSDDTTTDNNTTGSGESNQQTSSGTTTVITSGTGGDYVKKIIALVALLIGLTIMCVALFFCKQIIRSLTKKRNKTKDRKSTKKIYPVSSNAELYPSLDLDNVKERRNLRKIFPSSSQAELCPSVDLDNGRKSTQRNNTTSMASSLTNIQEDEALFDYTKRSTLPRSRVFAKRPLSTIVDDVKEELSVVVLNN